MISVAISPPGRALDSLYDKVQLVWSLKLAILFAGIEESLKIVPGAAGGADVALYGGAAGSRREDEKSGEGEDDGA